MTAGQVSNLQAKGNNWRKLIFVWLSSRCQTTHALLQQCNFQVTSPLLLPLATSWLAIVLSKVCMFWCQVRLRHSSTSVFNRFTVTYHWLLSSAPSLLVSARPERHQSLLRSTDVLAFKINLRYRPEHLIAFRLTRYWICIAIPSKQSDKTLELDSLRTNILEGQRQSSTSFCTVITDLWWNAIILGIKNTICSKWNPVVDHWDQ